VKLYGSRSELQDHHFTKEGPCACVHGEKVKVCECMTQAIVFFEECERPKGKDMVPEKDSREFWIGLAFCAGMLLGWMLGLLAK
jgi:hypothetical protein